jgi:predicted transcriptional regulator
MNLRFVTHQHMKYRSRTDIVAMILDAANGGATKTKIMYKAYLSYAQLEEYTCRCWWRMGCWGTRKAS